MILPDFQLERRCNSAAFDHPLVTPFKQANLQPASIDLTLDSNFLIPQQDHPVDLADIKNAGEYDRIIANDSFTLRPFNFVLASTEEYIQVPPGLVASVEGKSSIARLGLVVHVTAGWIDPGFKGKITLELFNLSNRAIILRPGLRICQISFTALSNPALKPYGHPDLNSKYQNQRETTESRYRG